MADWVNNHLSERAYRALSLVALGVGGAILVLLAFVAGGFR